MTQLEQELVWLTKKVNRDSDLIKRAEAYFDDHQLRWSRGVLEGFMIMLERMKDQHYFEQSRLEKLAWKIVMEREDKSREIP